MYGSKAVTVEYLLAHINIPFSYTLSTHVLTWYLAHYTNETCGLVALHGYTCNYTLNTLDDVHSRSSTLLVIAHSLHFSLTLFMLMGVIIMV